MNNFFLDRNPKVAARYHIDKHAVKMPTEYMQMMCTAHRVLDGDEYYDRTANGRRIKRWKHFDAVKEEALYKASHVNHPANVWIRKSTYHYLWFYELWLFTAKEYQKRYGREHATVEVGRRCGIAAPPMNLYDEPWEEPPACMPDEYKTDDIVESYRNYYRGDKVRFATYKNRVPEFMKDVL